MEPQHSAAVQQIDEGCSWRRAGRAGCNKAVVEDSYGCLQYVGGQCTPACQPERVRQGRFRHSTQLEYWASSRKA